MPVEKARFFRNHWEGNAAYGVRQSQRQGKSWHDLYTNWEDETASDALHHTLGQHKMPQLRAEGNPEHREDPKDAAYPNHWFVFAT